MITGICAFLAALVAGLLVFRRAASARGLSPSAAGSTGQSAYRDDAQTLLREWEKENAVRAIPRATGNRTSGADDALPAASSPHLALGGGSADVRLWNELVESAQNAQAARGQPADATHGHEGSDVGRA